MDLSSFVTTTWNVFMILFPTVLLIGVFVTWMAWVRGCGRFRSSPTNTDKRETTIRYMIVKFLTEIINDFKYILAIFLICMFIITVLSIIYFALFQQKNFTVLKDGLEVAVATLGGLVGSIVGYYFGESAATKRTAGSNGLSIRGEELVQNRSDEGMIEASRPPDLNDT